MLNIIVGLFFYLYTYPHTRIPSDEKVFALDTEIYSKCLSERLICSPSIRGEFTKPVFIIAAGIVHNVVGRFIPISPLEAINLLSYISLGIIGFFLQLLIVGHQKEYYRSVIVLVIFYTSVTVNANQLWVGYSTFLACLVLMSIYFLYSIITHENKKVFIAAYLTTSVAAFYSQLSSLPYLVGSGIVGLLWSKYYLKDSKKALFLFKLFLIAILLVIAGDVLSLVVQKASYLKVFWENALLNVEGQMFLSGSPENFYTSEKNLYIFHLIVPLYYISVEFFYCFILLGATIFLLTTKSSLKKVIADYHPLIFVLLSYCLAFLLLSGGNNQKLLRSFFPLHVGFILLLFLYLEYFLRNIKQKSSIFFLSFYLLAFIWSAGKSYSLISTLSEPQKAMKDIVSVNDKSYIFFNPDEEVWKIAFESGISMFYNKQNNRFVSSFSLAHRFTEETNKVNVMPIKEIKKYKGEKVYYLLSKPPEGMNEVLPLKKILFFIGSGSFSFWYENEVTAQYAAYTFLRAPFSYYLHEINPYTSFLNRKYLYLYQSGS
ncbi:MAG: hypothetical protein HQK84_05250 [Nitrospinae bacterium]|nr:hypothetical protein [Nitrospinota bacterium]